MHQLDDALSPTINLSFQVQAADMHRQNILQPESAERRKYVALQDLAVVVYRVEGTESLFPLNKRMA